MLFNEKTTETIKMCRCCFMCRHACPTFLATKLDSHTPRGYAINLARINEGMADWYEEGFERLFHCSQCGLCKELCEFSWPEDEMVLEGRREMIKAGKEPAVIKKAAKDLMKNRELENDMFNKKIYDKKNCDILYIAGTALKNGQEDIIRSVCEIFENTKMDYTMQSIEDISGIILSELGYTEDADKWIKGYFDKINALSPKRIVVSCAHTYDFLKNHKNLLNKKDITIEHVLEIIGEKIENEEIDFKKEKEEKVMYHDPCRIGRGHGIYDTPRMIIEACSGGSVVEFHHSKDEAECCGAGGCVNLTYPKIASCVAAKRIEQAIDEEVKTVVTACPNCKKVFEEAAEQKDIDIEVLDIAEYALKNL